MVFRLIELALLLICLGAVAIMGYRYYRAAAARRDADNGGSLDKDVTDFLKKKRQKE